MNLSWINEQYFCGLSGAEINNGNCYNWALIANHFYSTRLYIFHEDGGHAFVKIGARYFDAESPHGVYNWYSLNFFRKRKIAKDKLRPYCYGMKNFVYYWFSNGKTPLINLNLDLRTLCT